ncbi:MAG: hypothetical protein JF606_17080 [Burkholderiales bacterium]|jgi:hypothetical protein|nr:hypothetical protein [Burkholderiales bacterium]
MDIELGKVGKIVAGQELGRYVKVVDDAASTGGFLILTAMAPDMQDGFDSWVESREMLQRFFEEAGWIVEWPQ